MIIGIDNVFTGLSTRQRTIEGVRHLLTDTVTWLEKVAPQHEYVLFEPNWADPLDLDTRCSITLMFKMNSGVTPLSLSVSCRRTRLILRVR